MKRLLVFLLFTLIGCSSTPTIEEVPPATPTDADYVACRRAAMEVQTSLQMINAYPIKNTPQVIEIYGELETLHTGWEVKNGPCTRPGTSPVERGAINIDVARELEDAENTFSVRATHDLLLNNTLDDARWFLRERFSLGRSVSEKFAEQIETASEAYNNNLLAGFEVTGAYGQIDEDNTTCIFSEKKLDRDAKPILAFTSAFTNATTVHTLCRIPTEASKYPSGGEFYVTLDDNINPNDGIVSEIALGPISKFGDGQTFQAEFDVPHKLSSVGKTIYYQVTLQIRRPDTDHQDIITNGFYWYKTPQLER